MTRCRGRTDADHAAIVQALRACGAGVESLASIGRGCPDLLVWRPSDRRLVLMEVKDGAKPPSERRLTDDERRWHADWPGEVLIVSSVDEALNAIGVQP